MLTCWHDGEDDTSADNDSEAETVVSEAKTLDTDDQDSLEREFVTNRANNKETNHTPRTPQHFVDAGPGDEPEQSDADLTTQNATRRSLAASPAAVAAVRKPRLKRKRSSHLYSEAGAEHRQSKKEPSPDGYYSPDSLAFKSILRIGHLLGLAKLWTSGQVKLPGEQYNGFHLV